MLDITMICPSCQKLVGTPGKCEDCKRAESSRSTFMRRHNTTWIQDAAEAGINLWERQPGETEHEYTVWCAFRDSYPGKKPTNGSVAQELGLTTNAVSKIAQQWQFVVRMQAWIKHCEDLTIKQRHNEVLSMNKMHIDTATKLNEKLLKAVDRLDPDAMKPSDIVALAKLTTDLERKARLDTATQEQALAAMSRAEFGLTDQSAADNKNLTSKEDLNEIVGILSKAGILGETGALGVKTTKTTEVVLKLDGSETYEN